MYRSGRCFALSRTAPQAPSCRARVMRHQVGVSGAEGRVSSWYKISKAQGRPASRRIAYTAGVLALRLLCSAVVAVVYGETRLATGTTK